MLCRTHVKYVRFLEYSKNIDAIFVFLDSSTILSLFKSIDIEIHDFMNHLKL
ncbi:hypothetical protein [Leptospira noguchii]|uniref:Uncharacterized protein n=1 Tax=Leptospira noguchii TaxID=28182 RepID=A0AAE9K7P6_9LEPT|nr:hypothetical protein [Leptospira noguchii]UOG28921.1 hypothetical protein MAL06_09265 [Leptospira noguchii]UOG55111.1 hypothetical protein MAL03_09130 [Leptospira noguchii]